MPNWASSSCLSLLEIDAEISTEIEHLQVRLQTLQTRASRTSDELWTKSHRKRARETRKALSTLEGSRRALRAQRNKLERRWMAPDWASQVSWGDAARLIRMWVS